MTKVTRTICEHQYTFFIISCSVLLSIKILKTKFVQKIHIIGSKFFFFENCDLYEIMWKNMADPERLQMK